MNQLKELREQIGKLREEEYEIEKAERIKQNKGLVGKCFKYLNSYGSSEKWWLYTKVLRLDDEGYPVAWRFQIDCHGQIEISPPEERSYVYPGNGYQPITVAEFGKQWRATIAAVAKFSGL